ncbi:hypothetical protein FACS1894170_07060 [Planctomycetales bacterium]|nr:hypothetical protein FACS1894170_07060 [Planctomycetales bacterium]
MKLFRNGIEYHLDIPDMMTDKQAYSERMLDIIERHLASKPNAKTEMSAMVKPAVPALHNPSVSYASVVRRVTGKCGGGWYMVEDRIYYCYKIADLYAMPA